MRAPDVVIVGGCGHVGLPLGLAFAECGLRVVAYDRDGGTVARVNRGEMPFLEPGGSERLPRLIDAGCFEATTDPSSVSGAEHVVVVVGTPVDEHLNPDANAVPAALSELLAHLSDTQIVILRSTVFPGVSRMTADTLRAAGLEIDVAFCPERIAEGKALVELRELPQIVAGTSPAAVARARKLFERLTPSIVETTLEEAELAKLFTNAWRYIKFAAVNQFFMIANDFGVDFERVRQAMTQDYPRAADMPGPGFAAGPCLFKDTMQLSAFNNNNFALGHASMLVNEGLPLYVVSRMERQFDLRRSVVGILGMAFKADSDDTRSSLSFKLRRLLQFKAAGVLCTDPYVTDDRLIPLDAVLEKADILVLGVPHREYSGLQTDLPTIDIWNMLGRGVLI